MLVAGFVGYLSDFCCVIMCAACGYWFVGIVVCWLLC